MYCLIIIFFGALDTFDAYCGFNIFKPKSKQSHKKSFLVESNSETYTDNNSDVKEKLLELIKSTDRGSIKSENPRIYSSIKSLPQFQSNHNSLIDGWELIWSDDDLTRASPFFWAFRKALKDVKNPTGLMLEQNIPDSVFKITDSLPLKNIGSCKQKFSDDKLISEIEVIIGFSSENRLSSSIMTTTSSWKFDETEPNLVEINVEKTQVIFF